MLKKVNLLNLIIVEIIVLLLFYIVVDDFSLSFGIKKSVIYLLVALLMELIFKAFDVFVSDFDVLITKDRHSRRKNRNQMYKVVRVFSMFVLVFFLLTIAINIKNIVVNSLSYQLLYDYILLIFIVLFAAYKIYKTEVK